MNQFVFFSFLCIFLSISQITASQSIHVVKDVKQYEKVAVLDSNQRMVDLHCIPHIQLDLRYATSNNFTHQQLYPQGRTTYLRLAAANALAKVQNECTAKGFGIKIFDAYRPYSVSVKMWNLIHDDRYVANPVNGSGHNRGTTVDITLVDLKTDRNVDMGTDFDNFTDSAHHGFTALPEAALQNRKFLRAVMEKYGFKALETEWWHYSYGNSKAYEVLDLSFKTLRKVSRGGVSRKGA